MKAVMAVLVLAVLVMGSGCASMMSQTYYPVPINSAPAGATVTVRDVYGQNVFAGTTPTVATLSASAGYFIPARYTFTFEKQGFQPAYAVIEANTDPWYFMNVFNFFFGAVFIDPVTGAMWELNRSVGANLAPLGPGQPQPQPAAVTPSVSTTTVTAPPVYTPPPVVVPPPPVVVPPPVVIPPLPLPFPHP